MFCIPFLGCESFLPESRNCLYGGPEVTAFITAPTSKFDVARLASKRQRNLISSIQQESLGSLSCVAGIWHGGAKASVAEQAFKASVAEQPSEGPKPSTKTLDAVKQSQRVPKVKFFTGSKSSPQGYTRLKPAVRNFEEQLAVLERIQLQSQVLYKGIDQSEEAQETHKSDIHMIQQNGNPQVAGGSMMTNQAVKGPHPSPHESLENQFNCGTPSASQVDHSQAGLICTEVVWNEPFLGVHGVPLGGNKQVLHQPSKSRVNSSPQHNEINGLEGNEEGYQVHRSAHQTNTHQAERQTPNYDRSVYQTNIHQAESQTSNYNDEDLRVWNKKFVNGHDSLSQGSRAAYLDTLSSGSMNGMSANGFNLQRQGYGNACSNAGEQGLTTRAEATQTKGSVNFSGASCRVASVRMPVYRTSTPLQQSLSDTIFYLESLGVDCSRLFRDNPAAMTCTVRQLRALVCALERYGLKSSDFGRIFNLCPKILHLKPDGDLRAVASFLFDEVGLSRKDFGKVVRRCPRLLASDIQEQLRPTLSFLHTLGFSKMGQVVSNNPTLLSFSVERRLMPKLRFLESLGFTYREAASMVVRFPAIFNYSISDNLQPKYDYLVHEMGGRNKDLLAFPQYFGYSLETRIRPRHKCIAKLDVSLSIQAILKLSDGEFNARFSSGGGHNQPPEVLSVSPERSDAMVQDPEYAKFASLEPRVLVSV